MPIFFGHFDTVDWRYKSLTTNILQFIYKQTLLCLKLYQHLETTKIYLLASSEVNNLHLLHPSPCHPALQEHFPVM